MDKNIFGVFSHSLNGSRILTTTRCTEWKSDTRRNARSFYPVPFSLKPRRGEAKCSRAGHFSYPPDSVFWSESAAKSSIQRIKHWNYESLASRWAGLYTWSITVRNNTVCSRYFLHPPMGKYAPCLERCLLQNALLVFLLSLCRKLESALKAGGLRHGTGHAIR